MLDGPPFYIAAENTKIRGCTMTNHPVNPPVDADAERLASLGYKSEFKRDMSL